MISSRKPAAPAALALLLLYAPTAMGQQFAGQTSSQGCYSSAQGLTFANTFQYQTQGSCQTTCVKQNMPVMGLTNGADCWCGSELPPQSAQVESSQCSHVCNGYDQNCGGQQGTFGIFLTGLTKNVGTFGGDLSSLLSPLSPSSAPSAQPSSQQSSSQQSSTQQPQTSTQTQVSSTTDTTTATPVQTTLPPSVVTVGGGTSVVTKPGSTVTLNPDSQAGATGKAPSPSQTSSSGPSTGAKVGIAVGVIGGAIVLVSLVAGAILYMKRKRSNDDIVNRHRRNTSANAFASEGSVGGTRNASMSDSRLDPTMVERERRASNGSVFADNEDYSRRILKVTN